MSDVENLPMINVRFCTLFIGLFIRLVTEKCSEVNRGCVGFTRAVPDGLEISIYGWDVQNVRVTRLAYHLYS